MFKIFLFVLFISTVHNVVGDFIDNLEGQSGYQLWAQKAVNIKYVLGSPYFTLFIVNNSVAQKYPNWGKYDMNRMVSTGFLTDDELPSMINSQDSSPLWISKDEGKDYVNQIEILRKEAVGVPNHQACYIADVLPEIYKKGGNHKFTAILKDPSFLSFADDVKDGVSFFWDKIKDFELEQFIDNCQGCTIFIPARISPDAKKYVTREVILAHILQTKSPKFTPHLHDNETYQTALNNNNKTQSNITKIMKYETRGSAPTIHLKSSLRGLTPQQTHLGATTVQMFYSDVPTIQGVIHFTYKPFLLVHQRVSDILKYNENLSIFHNFVRSYKPVRDLIERGGGSDQQLTVFAFDNASVDLISEHIRRLSLNETAKFEIIGLHFVEKFIASEAVNSSIVYRSQNDREVSCSSAEGLMYVEAGGVKAQVVVHDIVATDGIIHVIKKVLGVPSSLINDKLSEDPKFNITYNVAGKSREEWLERLGNKNKNFTLFVPSDEAWGKLSREYPSFYKQLVEGFYTENAYQILQRHVVEDKMLSREDLSKLTSLKTLKGELEVEDLPTSDQTGLKLKWMKVIAGITRPNIKAINGIIHEIDTVIMDEGDMKVSEAEGREAKGAGKSLLSQNAHLYSFIFIILTLLALN